MPNRGTNSGDRGGSTERDERGRFTEDSSDRSSNRSQTNVDRDDRGRFTEEGSDRSGSNRGSMSNRSSTRKK